MVNNIQNRLSISADVVADFCRRNHIRKLSLFGYGLREDFSDSSNGLLLVIAVLLVLAWKIAGYIGADYFLLRWLGVPWKNDNSNEKTAKRVAAGL